MSYFTLFRVAGVFGGLYSCMSRRGEEEKNEEFSSVFLLVGSGLIVFQLDSVLVSCLKEIRVAFRWCWKSLGKKHCGVNHGKRICMANETLV